jgi:nucleoid-associated protein YgaU
MIVKNWRSKMVLLLAAAALTLNSSCTSSSEELQGEEVIQGQEQVGDGVETSDQELDTAPTTLLPEAPPTGAELDAVPLSPIPEVATDEFTADSSGGKVAESASDSGASTGVQGTDLAQVDSAETSPVQLPEESSVPEKVEPEKAEPKATSSQSSFSNSEQFVYTVKRGDWLARVTKKVYGNSGNWRDVAKENGLKDANLIQAGQKLIFKITNEKSRNFSKSYKQVAWKKYYDYPKVGPDGKATIFVKPGDSLSKIASLVFGDPYQWKNIYSVNKGQILNPNLIFADQKLSFVVDIKQLDTGVEAQAEAGVNSQVSPQEDTLASPPADSQVAPQADSAEGEEETAH